MKMVIHSYVWILLILVVAYLYCWLHEYSCYSWLLISTTGYSWVLLLFMVTYEYCLICMGTLLINGLIMSAAAYSQILILFMVTCEYCWLLMVTLVFHDCSCAHMYYISPFTSLIKGIIKDNKLNVI